MYGYYGGRSVDGAKPDMTVEKQIDENTRREQRNERTNCIFLF